MEPTNLKELLSFVKDIRELIAEEVALAKEQTVPDPYQSAQTNELDAAMAKALGEYSSIGNNRVNPFFKSEYADYDTIMTAIRPILAKHGLSLRQYTVIDKETGGGRVLHTRVCHSSGQWAESRERIIPEKNDDQKWASTITFKKRHQAMAILNITIDKDKYDDDAEENMKVARLNDLRGTSINHNYESYDKPAETINKLEYEELARILQGWPDLCQDIQRHYKISSLGDLPKASYAHVKAQVLRNIEARTKGTTPAAK